MITLTVYGAAKLQLVHGNKIFHLLLFYILIQYVSLH